MNYKRILGLCIFVVGIAIIVCSVDAIHKIAEAKGLHQSVHDFFHNNPSWNPLIKFFGGKPEFKVSHSDNQAVAAMICGIAITVVGAVMAIFRYKPKKHK